MGRSRCCFLLFLQRKKKKTRAHKWRARGKSRGDRKHSGCCGADFSSPSHCERKGTAHALIISSEMICTSIQLFRAPLSLSEHPPSTLTKMQSWLPNPDFEIGAQADRGEKRKQGQGRKKIRSRSPTEWKLKFQPDAFLQFPWLHNSSKIK